MLVCCEKYLKPLGWNSNGTISRGLKELKENGLLIQTRQGMMPPSSQAAWFALAWLSLDVYGGLDIDPNSYKKTTFIPHKRSNVINKPTPIKGARNL